jgi:2-polyprenyl-6-methoxyphenol hydroxylase-like FAD-dependent oxidoreductase
VADSDSNHVAAVPILTSIPVERWDSTNITLLGDAIHTMTPLQGLGGSSALRDAALLCRKLVEVEREVFTLATAIREYKKAMIEHGFAAVRRSARFGVLVVTNSRLLRGAFKTTLRVAMRIPPLKRLLFRPPPSCVG